MHDSRKVVMEYFGKNTERKLSSMEYVTQTMGKVTNMTLVLLTRYFCNFPHSIHVNVSSIFTQDVTTFSIMAAFDTHIYNPDLAETKQRLQLMQHHLITFKLITVHQKAFEKLSITVRTFLTASSNTSSKFTFMHK